MDEEQRRAVLDFVAKKYGKKVEQEVDPEVVALSEIDTGDEEIDTMYKETVLNSNEALANNVTILDQFLNIKLTRMESKFSFGRLSESDRDNYIARLKKVKEILTLALQLAQEQMEKAQKDYEDKKDLQKKNKKDQKAGGLTIVWARIKRHLVLFETELRKYK